MKDGQRGSEDLQAASGVKKILLISSGIVHPNLLARLRLRRVVSRAQNLVVEYAGRIEDAGRLRDGEYAAVVVYLHRRHISPAALAAIDRFVAAGGGLLGVHSATASFKQVDAWFDILGGRFVGHGAPARFEVRPRSAHEPVFGAPAPFRLYDELYVHACKPDIDVHFSAELRGEEHPVVWTRRHGAGRVCYVEPGHCAGSMLHPSLQAIILRGLEWICGRGEDSADTESIAEAGRPRPPA